MGARGGGGHGGSLNRTGFWNIRDCGIVTAGPRFRSAQPAMGGPMGFGTRWRSPLLPPRTYLPGFGGDGSAYVGALSFSPPFSLSAIFFFFYGRRAFIYFFFLSLSLPLQFLLPSCQLLKPVLGGRGERSKLSRASHLTLLVLIPFFFYWADIWTGFPGSVSALDCLSVCLSVQGSGERGGGQ